MPNVAFLADLYHLARMGEPVERLVRAALRPRSGTSRSPTRPAAASRAPGSSTGTRCSARLAASGYSGHVGLEYRPVGPSAASFDWLPRHLRSATVEENVTTIGFIGLGIMGGPMAANLLAAGHTVLGYDTQPAAVERLVAAGGKAAELVPRRPRADVVITMLPDSPQVEEVVLGPGGVLARASRACC